MADSLAVSWELISVQSRILKIGTLKERCTLYEKYLCGFFCSVSLKFLEFPDRSRWLTVGLLNGLKMGQVPGKAKVIREWGLLAPSPDLLGEGWLEIELHNLDSDSESFWVGEHIEMLGGECTQRGPGRSAPSPHTLLYSFLPLNRF